jgi:very-short-patch-repair endonuclease
VAAKKAAGAVDFIMTYIFNNHSQKAIRQRLRHQMPAPEVILWSCLKKKTLSGYKFRRQYGIDRYIVDFYCPKAKLAIELDGDSHFTEEAREYDHQRQMFIESLGIKVIRFTNLDICKNLNGALWMIDQALESK